MPTVNSELQIINLALTHLGAERINSINEQNNRAQTMKLLYPVARDKALAAHPWNFAIAYRELGQINDVPDAQYEYSYLYEIPDDILRVIGTDLYSDDAWEEIEDRVIACNADQLKIKGILRVEDVAKYSANFVEYLAAQLAEDASYPITQSGAVVERMVAIKTETRRSARSYDAQVGSTKQVVADDWAEARRRR